MIATGMMNLNCKEVAVTYDSDEGLRNNNKFHIFERNFMLCLEKKIPKILQFSWHKFSGDLSTKLIVWFYYGVNMYTNTTPLVSLTGA